jgi:flagellar basal body-associated protein FliL
MSEIVQIVSTVGFPIAACLAMAWYVKYITDKNSEKISEMGKHHKEEMTMVTEVLRNNTLAVQKLTDYITVCIGEIEAKELS